MKLFSKFRKKETPSLEKALRILLSQSEYDFLLASTPDRRHLVEAAAKLIALSEREALCAISELLKIPVLHRVPAIELQNNEVLNFQDLKQAGAIYLVSGSAKTSLVCVDPSSALSMLSWDLKKPLFLAQWSQILAALDESERKFNESREARGFDLANKHIDTINKLLALLTEEVASYGQDIVTIKFHNPEIQYHFTTATQQSATGSINMSVRDPLYWTLVKHSREKDLLTVNDSDGKARDLSIIYAGSDDSFSISWRKQFEVLESQETSSPIPPQNLIPFPALQEHESPEQKKDNLVDVLVIDDNVTFLRVLERFLEKASLSCVAYDSPLKAIEDLGSQSISPRVIISDVHMPELDGFHFAQKLKENPLLSRIPTIYLTSDEDVETEIKLLSLGAELIVRKNQDPRLVSLHVARILRRLEEIQRSVA